jgi:hypothetical protein
MKNGHLPSWKAKLKIQSKLLPAGNGAQVAECLPIKCEALKSNPSIAKKSCVSSIQ